MSEEKMKAFISDSFDEYYPECGDIDGGFLQDLAEKHGILVPEIRHEPCGEFCNCAQVVYDEEWQEGVKCYRPANWLSAEHYLHTDAGDSSANYHYLLSEFYLHPRMCLLPPALAGRSRRISIGEKRV